MAESGDADLVSTLDPAGYRRMGSVDTVTAVAAAIPRVMFLKVNAGHESLNTPEARRALSLGIDREGIAIGISLIPWVEYFRYTRQRTRILLASPAVEASLLLGFGPMHILRRHIVPELVPGLITLAAFGVASAVTAMAALGFVSVGLRPPTAEWGVTMTQLLPYWREAPRLIAQPVACLVLTVLSLHLAVGISARPQP